MDMQSRVRPYIPQYQKLKYRIAQLSNVPHLLPQQVAVTHNHKAQFDRSNQFLQQTRRLIAQRRKEIKDLKGVTMSSIFAKVSGQHKSKIHKKEEELKNLLDRELKSAGGTRRLQQQYAVQANKLRQLQGQSQEVDQLRSQQRRILQTIFAGAINGYPREYQLENELNQRKVRLTQLQNSFQGYSNCQRYLQQALQSLNSALGALGGANDMATLDLFMSNRRGMNTFVDVAKHQKVRKAKEHVQVANQSINQARQIIPNLPYIKSSKVGTSSAEIFVDIAFDNIFTDLMMKQKIQRMRTSVQEHRGRVNQVVQWIAIQVNQFHQGMAQEHQLVLTTETNLVRERMMIMDLLIQGSNGNNNSNVVISTEPFPVPVSQVTQVVMNPPMMRPVSGIQQQQQQEQQPQAFISYETPNPGTNLEVEESSSRFSNPPMNFRNGTNSNNNEQSSSQQQLSQQYIYPTMSMEQKESLPSAPPSYNPDFHHELHLSRLIPNGVNAVPFQWEYLGKELEYSFYAGFFGVEQEKDESLRLRSRPGWAVGEKATIPSKKKEEEVEGEDFF